MLDRFDYLLLQVRNDGDPMRAHELGCFARTIGCAPDRIRPFDLLSASPTRRDMEAADMLLMGGSGHYSAVGDNPWLDRILDALREIHALGRPTFASCWGFQAMARAMGGRVVHNAADAELGTLQLHLTPQGRDDPVFSPLGGRFDVQAGHEDHVVRLPDGAVLLASSDRVPNQAYRFRDRPIYCTQFHPELRREDLLARIRAYPEYVRHIAGISIDEFVRRSRETPQAAALLPRLIQHLLEGQSTPPE